MALGPIGDITDQATGLAESFTSVWQNGSMVKHALQKVKPALWNKNPGYLFEMDGANYKKYRLQLNPQSIKQSEPFSIKIIPTQSGIVTENEGFVLKDLVISGTTGIYPSRGPNGVPDGGYSIDGNKSGYQEFLDFRNFIREYAEIKKSPTSSNVKLIFKNFKDNEFWYVEPVKFDGSRSKDTPFSYNYEVTFKIIGKAETLFDSFLSALGIDNILDGIENSIDVFNGYVGLLENIESAVSNILILPLETAMGIIQGISQGVIRVSSLPRKFYEDIVLEAKTLADNFADFIGFNDSRYDEIYNRTPTLTNSPTADQLSVENMAILKAFVDAITALNQFISSNDYFDEDTPKVLTPDGNIISEQTIINKQASSIKNIQKAFNNKVLFPTPSSVTGIIVQSGDTLEKIAMRELNDATRWVELIPLNKLKPPYLSDTASEGVVAVGSYLLVPSDNPKEDVTSFILNSRETSVTKNLNNQEKVLGVDIKVNKEADFIVNNRQDLELTSGFDNVYQALMLKMGYQKGSLTYHPKIGLSLTIGEKNTIMMDEIENSIRDTILSDPRIKDLTYLKFDRDGSTVKLDMRVLLMEPQLEVPFLLTF